ncbi:MAG: hypothetical protein AABZ47_03310 [Planctomycetota bacterium]
MSTHDDKSLTPSGAPKLTISIPVGRAKALSKATVLFLPGALLGIVTGLILADLRFIPSGASNRIVDYAVAALALGLAIISIFLLIRGGTWLLLSLWPGHVGIHADEHELRLCLGPFKARRFIATELRITYPFDTIDNGDDVSFEAYLPEEVQIQTLLPAIIPHASAERLDRVLLQFAKGSEPQVATALSAVFMSWRMKGTGKVCRFSEPRP